MLSNIKESIFLCAALLSALPSFGASNSVSSGSRKRSERPAVKIEEQQMGGGGPSSSGVATQAKRSRTASLVKSEAGHSVKEEGQEADGNNLPDAALSSVMRSSVKRETSSIARRVKREIKAEIKPEVKKEEESASPERKVRDDRDRNASSSYTSVYVCPYRVPHGNRCGRPCHSTDELNLHWRNDHYYTPRSVVAKHGPKGSRGGFSDHSCHHTACVDRDPFAHSPALHQHIAVRHCKTSDNQCQRCHCHQGDLSNLRKHVRACGTLVVNGKFPCDTCTNTTYHRSPGLLGKHLKEHHHLDDAPNVPGVQQAPQGGGGGGGE